MLVLDAERFARLQQAGTLDKILADVSTIKKIVLLRATRGTAGVQKYGDKIVLWEEVMEATKGKTMPDVPLAADEGCSLYYSSGTTGQVNSLVLFIVITF